MQLKLQFALQRVAILLVFFGFTSAVLWTYQTGPLKLQDLGISTFQLFTFPNNVPGPIEFSVNSTYDIKICFQATVAPVTFAACDPKQIFTWRANSTTTTALLSRFDDDMSVDLRDDFFNPRKIQSYIELLSKPQPTQIFQNNTYFLAGRRYWVAAQFIQDHNGTFTIDFTATQPTCTPPNPYATPFGDCYPAPFSLQPANPISTSVAGGKYTYVQVVIPAPLNSSYYTGDLNFTVSVSPDGIQTNSTYNATVYIQRDALSGTTPNLYDAMYTVTGNSSSPFTIPTPLPGTYYVLINNTNLYKANLTATANYNTGCIITNTTAPNCPVKNITSPAPSGATDTVTGTQYFEFNTTELIFGVGTSDLTNAPPIYLSVNQTGWPSQYSYVAKSQHSDVNFFNFEVSPSNPQPYRFVFAASNNTQTPQIWRVAVIANDSQSYYYWAGTYCPYNCTGGPGKTKQLGTCDQSTGKCTCTSSKASPLFCERTGLSVGWIIVIIIIVIIVVACAIGIPLALYLRQRRSKNYERV